MQISGTEFIIFIILCIFITGVSRRTLFNTNSHGFYRFFGWIAIAWLIVNNYKYWIVDPFGLRQIIAWIFLFYALFLVLAAVGLFRKIGRASAERAKSELYQFEKTTALIRSGVYRYVRHPMYGSLIFLTWGILLKHIDQYLTVIAVIASILFIITAKIEEKENIEYFGEEYNEYKKHSKMFVPFLF